MSVMRSLRTACRVGTPLSSWRRPRRGRRQELSGVPTLHAVRNDLITDMEQAGGPLNPVAHLLYPARDLEPEPHRQFGGIAVAGAAVDLVVDRVDARRLHVHEHLTRAG